MDIWYQKKKKAQKKRIATNDSTISNREKRERKEKEVMNCSLDCDGIKEGKLLFKSEFESFEGTPLQTANGHRHNTSCSKLSKLRKIEPTRTNTLAQ